MSIPHAMTKENSHNHGQDPPKEFLWETISLNNKKKESIELLNQIPTSFNAVSYYKNKELWSCENTKLIPKQPAVKKAEVLYEADPCKGIWKRVSNKCKMLDYPCLLY